VCHLHAPQQPSHRHGRERPVTPLARKHKVAGSHLGEALKDLNRPRGQGNAVLATGLHPLSRNRPNLRVQVHLGPPRPKRLPRSGGGQDHELKRLCSDGFPLAQARDEVGHGLVRHSGMVATRELAALRQQLVEMPSPAGGVLSSAQALSPCGVQNALDPAA